MGLMLKIGITAILAALCATVLRRTGGEFAVLLMLAAGVWMLCVTGQALGDTVAFLGRLARVAQMDMDVVEPVVKVVSLSIITRVAAEVCRTAGEGGIAACVELAGAFLALAATLPLMNAVVEMIAGLLV